MDVTTIGPDHTAVVADRPSTPTGPDRTPIATWQASASPSEAPARRGTRLLGTGVAVAIALAPAAIGLAATGSPFLALGIPAAGIVGAMLGPSITARGGIAGAAFSMAALAIGIGDLLLLLGLLVGAEVTQTSIATVDPATAVFGLGYIGLIGLVIVGVPMLIVTIPCGFVWAVVVRRLVAGGRGVADR